MTTRHFRCSRCFFDLYVFLRDVGGSKVCEQKLFRSIYCLANLYELGGYISYYFNERERQKSDRTEQYRKPELINFLRPS